MSSHIKSDSKKNKPPKSSLRCLDPESWRSPSKDELRDHYSELKEQKKDASTLIFQRHLVPVDVYTYLKARFGEPNGFMNFLKSPTSDNLIHWDYLLKCDDVIINIIGIHRGVQITICRKLKKSHWRTLVEKFRKEYAAVSINKSKEHKKLEEWHLFINRYLELCSEAALYYDIVYELQDFEFKTPDSPNKNKMKKWKKEFEAMTGKFHKLKQACLSLKLLTPIILEAFINLLILITCKKEIRENKNIYEARIREDLNIKIPSLHINCDHFEKPIDINSIEYKNFSRIMNERNWFFHGNADPHKDRLETIYFDKNTPLYKIPGDVHEKYFGMLLKMIQPKEILEKYVKAHEFMIYVVNCFKAEYREQLWAMLESNSLGYNIKDDRFGVLLPDVLVSTRGQGIKDDQELFENS